MINKQLLEERLNEMIDYWQPSGALAVYENNNEVYQQFMGYQDIENAVKTTADTNYVFSSHSKSLVSLCILQLAERGQLSLDDYLDKYIPEYPHASRIKIVNLLAENSGIPDCFTAVTTKELEEDEEYSSMPFEKQFITERKLHCKGMSFGEMLMQLANLPLDYQPGIREHEESESNQDFLAEVICRVSKLSLFDYLQQYVFAPLNMTNTIKGCHSNGKSYRYYEIVNRVAFDSQECLNAITTTLSDLEKLCIGISQGKLLSSKYWKIAKRFNKWGISYCFSSRTGWHMFALYGILGYEIILSIKQSRQLMFISAYNDCGRDQIIGDVWHYFVGDTFSVLDHVTTYPHRPKVVPLKSKNVYETIKLSVTEEQKSFVWLPTIALPCSLVRKHNNFFVLEDCGVVVGLLILEVNKKEDYYYVSTVLIDKHYQKRGYGRIMVKWGVEWLKNKGAKELSIGVNRHNVAARALYTSLGFSPANVYDEGVNMKMKLD